MTTMLILVIVAALLFDFMNGWNDSANAIATVVSTRVLTPITAVIFASSLIFLGALGHERVAKMMSAVDESDEADLLRILEKIETNLNALVEE